LFGVGVVDLCIGSNFHPDQFASSQLKKMQNESDLLGLTEANQDKEKKASQEITLWHAT
jgi:hypothetical protein